MERTTTTTKRASTHVAPLLSGILLASLGGCWGNEGSTPKSASGEIRATLVDQVPVDDPRSQVWDRTSETSVTLLPQSVAYPMLGKATVGGLKVRALADKNFLALRMEWSDSTYDNRLEVDKFTDAVAVEIPLSDPSKTNPMMGSKEYPVYICHWKAVWQQDVDKGRADVQDYHPGYTADTYPFVSGSFPYAIEESFQTDNARRYFAGTAAGNPVSKIHRRWPVEELHAEGFGSLADHSLQDARGKGIYAGGRWTVIVALPREVADKANPALPQGGTVMAAFAVWDGGNQNVGGRKHWAPFTKIVLP